MYQEKERRYVLQKFKDGYKKNLSKEEIQKQIEEINGTEEEKEQLFRDCMVNVILDEMFNSNIKNRERAIELAIKYIQNNNFSGNIVKEKLLSFYRETKQIQKAKDLITEILKEEPYNKWTISKYVMILREEGKQDEALQFIEDKQEFVKKCPVILKLKYNILLKKGDIKNCIELLENNVLELEELGHTISDRKKFVKQLHIYERQLLNLNKEYFEKYKVRATIRKIAKKIKMEEKIINDMKEKEGMIEDDDRIKVDKDIEGIKRINMLICTKKEELKEEEIKKRLGNIQNKTIMNMMKWQIEHAYGKSSLEIVEEVKKFTKREKDFSELETKAIKVLQNFLTSKDARFYKHINWIQFQDRYFEKILKGKNVNQKTEVKERGNEK